VVTSGIVLGDSTYDIKVYINGTRYYHNTHFSIGITSSSLTINFIQANLGFAVDSADEISITGKFINV
jgi:hypothetical protein